MNELAGCSTSSIDHQSLSAACWTCRCGSGSMGSWQRLFEASGRLRGWGDCYAFVLAATGRCDLACDPLMNPWDAGHFPVILEEAGGIYSGWDGAPGIRGTNALAGNPALHAQARAIVWPK